MLKEEGIITATETAADGYHWAWVETRSQSACSACGEKTQCGTSALADYFAKHRRQIKALNRDNRQVGDKVIVGIEEQAVLHASALVYLLPLFSMFGSGLLTQKITQGSGELVTLAALAGLFGGFYMVYRISKNYVQNLRYQAVILAPPD